MIQKRGSWTRNELPLDARLRWVDGELEKMNRYPSLRKEKSFSIPHAEPLFREPHANSSKQPKIQRLFLPLVLLAFLIGGILAIALLSQTEGVFSGASEGENSLFASFFRSLVGGNAITGAALGVQPVEDEAPVSLRIAVGNLTVEQGQELRVTAWLTLSGTMAFAIERDVTLFLEEKEIAKEKTDEEGKAVFTVDTTSLVPGTHTLTVTASEARDWALVTIVAANISGAIAIPEPVAEDAAALPGENAVSVPSLTLPVVDETIINETEASSPSPLTGSVVIQPLPEEPPEPIDNASALLPQPEASSNETPALPAAPAVEVMEPAVNTSQPAAEPEKQPAANASNSSVPRVLVPQSLGIFTAPTLYSVVLNSTIITANHTDVNLTLYFNTTDTVGVAKNITTWTVNGTPFAVVMMPFEGVNNTASNNAWDYSGLGYNGSEEGGVVWNATGGYDGKGAYEFDGIDDAVRPTLVLTPLQANQSSRSITAWFKTKGVCNHGSGGTSCAIVCNAPASSYGECFFSGVGVNTNGVVFCTVGYDGAYRIINGGSVKNNTWNMVAYTFDNTTRSGTCYVNGVRAGSYDNFGTQLDQAVGNGIWRIGNRGGSTQDGGLFNGTIDEVMIFNRSLSYQQIWNIFANRTTEIAFNETKRGDYWQGCLTPNNGTGDGSQVCSLNLTILNAKPTQGIPVLNATDHPQNRTDANLTAYNISSADIDGDRIKSIFNWFRNGTSITLLNMPFEGINGTAVNNTWDYSGYVIKGNITNEANNATWKASGGYDGLGAYQFDGTNDVIDAGTAVSSNGGPLTVMLWMNSSTDTSQRRMLATREPGGTFSGWEFLVETTANGGKLVFQGDVGASNPSATGTTDVRDKKWHHIAATWNGSHNSVYLDGVDDTASRVIAAGSLASTQALLIGRVSYSGVLWQGNLDDILIFNRSLSAEQIRAIFLNRTDLISSGETQVNDVWQACITPNDGYADGNTSCSGNLTILANAKPVVDTVVLNSTDVSTNNTNVNLTLYFNTTDGNGDSIKNITTWRRNGTSIMLLNMPFEKINGTDSANAWDYSGYGYTGTEKGGIVWSSTGGYDRRGAYLFDSVNDFIDLGDQSAFEFGNNPFTIIAWINRAGPHEGGSGTIISKYEDLNNNREFQLYQNATGNIIFFTSPDGAGAQELATIDNYSANVWVHLAVTSNGTNKSIYVNGTLVATGNFSGVATGKTGNLSIGAVEDSVTIPDTMFNGTIDDVMIFNRSLSPEQVYLLFINRTDRIANNETIRSETWQACITPNDGIEDGSQVCSNTITIRNAKPTQGLPVLNATDHPNNRTDANLTAYNISSADIDGDRIKSIFNWFRNGTSITVLNMPFEGVNGSTGNNTRDYSGYANTGAPFGVAWNASGGFDGLGAYKFDGANDFINISDTNSLRNMTTQFSLAVWVKLNAFPGAAGNRIVVRERSADSWNWALRNPSNADTKFTFTMYDGVTNAPAVSDPTTPSLNVWYHLAVTYNGSNISLYTNGALVSGASTTMGSLKQVAGQPVCIGERACTGSTNRPFDGHIDEVQIYNRTLSAEQVLALYNNRTDLIVSQETQNNDVWQACITPNDGYADGNNSCSVNLTIQANAKPVVDTIVLNSTDLSTNNTNVNLTLYFNSTDANSDSIKNITSWRVNGTPIMLLNMPFEEINRTDTNNAWDYSGKGNNGSVSGAIWLSTGGYDGRGAYRFDGADDEIQIAAILGNNTNPGTYAFWIYEYAGGNDPELIMAQSMNGADNNFCNGLAYNRSQNMLVAGYTNTVGSINTGLNASVNLTGRWTHIAYTWDSSSKQLYVNGDLKNSTNTGPSCTQALVAQFHLGRSPFDSHNLDLNATLDDVLIFNRSLSPEQIYLLYTNRTNIIALNETIRGDTWQACITPNDGFEDGVQVCSNTITILNTRPVADTVVLNTTNVTSNQTDVNLTLYFNTTDIDADGIKNITTWTVNSTPLALLVMPFEGINNTATNNAWDYSGLGYNGSEEGGVVWNATGGYDGKGAYEFDGIDDAVRPTLVLTPLQANQSSRSITAWFKTKGVCNHGSGGTSCAIVCNAPASSYGECFFSGVGVNTNGVVSCTMGYDGAYRIITGGSVKNNTWNMVAYTFDNTTRSGTCYVNGVRAGSYDNFGTQLDQAVGNGIWRIGDRGGSTQDGGLFNGTIDDVLIFNRSLSYQQIENLFRNTTHQINFNETQTNDVWRACITPNDGSEDGVQACSNTVTILSGAANNLPTAPVTGNPFNGSAITNRTPIFEWFNASDADGDVISYQLQVDDNAIFNNPEINVSAITDLSATAPGNTTWYSTVTLDVDTRYYWRVRANDSTGYGTWSNGASGDGPSANSNLSNFTIDSLLSVSLLTSAVEFGSMSPGTENDTTDNIPLPFRLENAGNILFNISVNGSALLSAVSFPSSSYQYKARENSSESGAFNTSGSTTTFTNMNTTRSLADVAELNWRNAFDEVFIDINVSVSTDEPSGKKSSTTTFTVTSSSLS